jgi:hypothetical protein
MGMDKPREWGHATENDQDRSKDSEPQSITEHTDRPHYSTDEEAHRAEERRYWGHQKFYNWSVGTVAFIAMLAAIVAACFAGGAYYETKRQADIALDTERRQLRAYVTFEDGKLIVSNPVSADIQIKNSGQTPAFGFTSWVGIRLINSVADTNDDEFFKFTETPAASQDIGAQSIRHLRPQNSLNLSEADFLAIRRGRKRIVIWGIAKYRDSFQRCQFSTFRVFSDNDPTAPLLSAARGNSATDPEYQCTQNPNRYQNKAIWPSDGDRWAP